MHGNLGQIDSFTFFLSWVQMLYMQQKIKIARHFYQDATCKGVVTLCELKCDSKGVKKKETQSHTIQYLFIMQITFFVVGCNLILSSLQL